MKLRPSKIESEVSDGKVNGQKLLIVGTVGQLGLPELPAIKCQQTVNSIPSLLKSSPYSGIRSVCDQKNRRVVEGCLSIVASANACFEV